MFQNYIMIGGEYVDNSSSTTKGFFMSTYFYGNQEFNYLYSTGNHDIVNKVGMGESYNFAAGKSGTGSSASFFLMIVQNKWKPIQLRQIGGDTNSVDPTSEIGKSFSKFENPKFFKISYKATIFLFIETFAKLKNSI